MSFFLPPLVVATAHLLTESPYSLDLAVQFTVITAVLVLVGQTAGPGVAWCVSAPFMAALVSGILFHRLGNATLNNSV